MRIKVCANCKKKKSISNFGKNKRTKDGYHYYCKLCRSKRNAKSWPQQKKRHKDKRLQRMYGITLDDYNDMFEQQKGVCKICGMVGKRKGLAVDHRHSDGKVRGLLCVQCNTLLGRIERNSDLISNILEYLKDGINEN